MIKQDRALWKRLSESLGPLSSEEDIKIAAEEFGRLYTDSTGSRRGGLVGLGKMQWKCLNVLCRDGKAYTVNEVNIVIDDEIDITRIALNGLVKRDLIDKVRDTSTSHYQHLYFVTAYGQKLLKDK